MLPLVSGNSENTHNYGKSLLTTQDFHGMTSLSVSFWCGLWFSVPFFFQLGPYQRFEKKQHYTHMWLPRNELKCWFLRDHYFHLWKQITSLPFPSFFFRASKSGILHVINQPSTHHGKNPYLPWLHHRRASPNLVQASHQPDVLL